MAGVNWPGHPVSYNPIIGCGGDDLPCIARCWAKQFCRRGMHPDHRKVAKWDGTVILREKELEKPLARKRPTLYAVCLLGDLFHRNVEDDTIDRVFAAMAMCPQHQFLLLTKKADRMRQWATTNPNPKELHDRGEAIEETMRSEYATNDQSTFSVHWPLSNVWTGVSASNQRDADERIPILQDTPAAHRWLSIEPCLGPIDLTASGKQGVGEQWIDYISAVVLGCESGPGRRPCPDKWLDDVAEQCRAAGVPAWVKQRDVNGRVVSQPLPAEWPWVPTPR